jgi:hypothetical protein
MGTVTVAAAVLLSGLLLPAGIAKLVSPSALAAALGELVGPAGGRRGAVRAVAAVELCAATLLALAPAAPATRVSVALLGAGFALAGLAGRLRSSTRPCGCFGALTTRALGLWNAALGAVFVAWAAVPPGRPAQVDRGTAVVAALAVATAVTVFARRHHLGLLVHRPANRERVT